MFDEDAEDYDEDVPGGTGFCHSRCGFCGEQCSEKDKGKGCAMTKIKVFEIVLIAISALIAAARAVIKFIGCVDKLQASAA
jgi:hypothetical protein